MDYLQNKFPESNINTQKTFRLQLVKELVQPMLTLKSSPTCPPHLNPIGRLPIAQEPRLIGKHFPYKSPQRKRCVVCSNKASPSTGKRCDKKTQNFCPLNVKLLFVWGNALKCITCKRHINPQFLIARLTVLHLVASYIS